MQAPNIIVAFFAGLLSFLSPCVLPLVPAYIGYLSGPAITAARAGAAASGNVGSAGTAAATATISSTSARWTVMAHALLFVLGFTFVFVVLIGGLAGGLSRLMLDHKRELQWAMGVLLIVFGIHMLGVINIPFLNYTKRAGDMIRPTSNASYVKSFLIGTGFAAGWTPCIGPILGSIITLSIYGDSSQAFVPFISYSIGLGIPFLLTAMAMGQISSGLKRLTRRMYSLKLGGWTAIDQVNIVSLVSGALLVVMGFLVFTNALTILSGFNPFNIG